MYLEVERKLYTMTIGALALASMLVVTLWYPISDKTFMQLARSIDNAKAVLIGEWVFRQLVAALICVIPLKLTRTRLSVVDGVLLGCIAMLPHLLMFDCDPTVWDVVIIATAPPLFMLVFWALRNTRPASWLDGYYSDQEPWMSTAFAGMFAFQLSTAMLIAASKGTLLHTAVLIALAGAALAILARRFDRAPLWILATGVFVFYVSLYVRAWPEVFSYFDFSCSEL